MDEVSFNPAEPFDNPDLPQSVDFLKDSASLYAEIPAIHRARDFRLYAGDGRRFLDFYQDAGHAVLGHRPKSLEKSIKTTVARGLYGSLPSVYQPRLEKALSALFPEMESFSVFASVEKAHVLLAGLGFDRIEDPVRGTAMKFGRESGNAAGRRCALWRPFSDLDYSSFEAFMPVLPLPGFHEIGIVCFREKTAVSGFPSISPVILAALSRIVHDLLWAFENGRSPAGILPARLPHSFMLWRRTGIYLIPSYACADHASVFHRFLSSGFLLPPAYDLPAVLPGEWSDGEKKIFLKLDEETLPERVYDGKQ